MRVAGGDDIAAAVRAAAGDAVTLVIEANDPLSQATAIAAIGPLALERVPMRVNAVVAEPGASEDDVDAAVGFLDSARSTTGQVLRVGQPRVRPHGPSCSSTNA